MERRDIMKEIRDVARQSADIGDVSLDEFRRAGYTKAQVERAVRHGILEWTRFGDLSLVGELRHLVVCDVNTGIEIRGWRAFAQTSAGDMWQDTGTSARLPMSREKAQQWIDRYIPFVAGPTQQRMIDALVKP